jgi:uncharacterized protein YigA (DUF484 family)
MTAFQRLRTVTLSDGTETCLSAMPAGKPTDYFGRPTQSQPADAAPQRKTISSVAMSLLRAGRRFFRKEYNCHRLSTRGGVWHTYKMEIHK